MKKIINFIKITVIVLLVLIINSTFVIAQSSDYTLINNGIKLDGTNSGTVIIEFKANKNLNIDSLEAYFSKNEEGNNSTKYFTLSNLTTTLSSGDIDNDSSNGLVYLVNSNGYSLQNNDVIWKATYNVNKDTPSGKYTIKLNVASLTEHNLQTEETFNLTTEVNVKSINDPYEANFVTDSGVDSIDVYYSEDYQKISESGVTKAYARNIATGLYDNTGFGEVNFQVNLKSGYIISSIDIAPIANSSTLVGPSDTKKANLYRVPKITGDIQITINTKVATEYTATFINDSNIDKVDIYYTHTYTTPSENKVTSTFARNSETGEVDITGNGEVNFLVKAKDGYKVNTPIVSGNFANLKGPSDTGVNNLYRVTKIYGDVIIQLTSTKRTSVVPEITGYKASYSYTGSSIKPSITVKISGSETNLVEGADYVVTYGENKNVGASVGSITIESIDTSDYVFNSKTINFDITKYELTKDNISIPLGVMYTGNPLTPNIGVKVNNIDLIENSDYSVEYTNQSGNVGEYITAKITGIGNYEGTIDNIKVLIIDKPLQSIKFTESELTKTYGENYTLKANHLEGDGIVTYSSSNTSIATVDNNGNVTLHAAGDVVITALASRTDNYFETSASYNLHITQKDLTITGAIVNNKVYDGNTTAQVSSVTFDGLVNSDNLNIGTDYTVNANFNDKNVGQDKNVVLTVNLSENISKKYNLVSKNYTTKANIAGYLINTQDITFNDATVEYTGSPIEIEVIVKVNNTNLIKDTDYTLTYSNNINVGVAEVVVTGIGNYATESPIKHEFTIQRKNITPTIETISDVTYNGEEQEPVITVKSGDVTLIKNVDYTVSYTNNINAGNGSVKISPKDGSNYVFDDTKEYATATFKIKPYELKSQNISLEYLYAKYDGTDKKPNVTVIVNKNTLVKDTDYEVVYSNNKEQSAEAKATIKAKSSNYSGEISVYFEISNKNELKISGIENQKVSYTELPVELSGNLSVSSNNSNITVNDLTIKWYNLNDEEINKPSGVGEYYVVYSYRDNDYIGILKVNFEITKKVSSNPSELNANLKGISGEKLSSVSLSTVGLIWKDGNEVIKTGSNLYLATYTENNDSVNYTTEEIAIPVYGKVYVDINTSVNGVGGTITPSISHVLEDTTKNISFTPEEGYEIDYVTVNGENTTVTNNTLSITTTNVNCNIIVAYKPIMYTLNISGTNVELDPVGIIGVNYNSSQNILIRAKYGYTLSSVLVNNVEMIGSLTGDTLALKNILQDTEISIVATKITYDVVEGGEQKYISGQDDSMSIRINADYSLFNENGNIYIDDKLIDRSNYNVKAGSTIITFSASFMNTLANGEHNLKVVFSDGGEAITTFDIENDSDETSINNPQTSDNINIIVFMFYTSSLGLLSGTIYLKKKNEIIEASYEKN